MCFQQPIAAAQLNGSRTTGVSVSLSPRQIFGPSLSQSCCLATSRCLTRDTKEQACGRKQQCTSGNAQAKEPETRPTSPERAPSVTLLGSGQRTPWTGYKLDKATREAILYAEVHMTTSP